jgi:hypothetical protein
MKFRLANVLDILSIAVSSGCVVSCLFLAVVAFRSSREVGAGAAQGDLGFFMMLIPFTAIVLVAVALSLLRKRWLPQRSKVSRLLDVLCGFALLALAWNWFFLLEVWRA